MPFPWIALWEEMAEWEKSQQKKDWHSLSNCVESEVALIETTCSIMNFKWHFIAGARVHTHTRQITRKSFCTKYFNPLKPRVYIIAMVGASPKPIMPTGDCVNAWRKTTKERNIFGWTFESAVNYFYSGCIKPDGIFFLFFSFQILLFVSFISGSSD